MTPEDLESLKKMAAGFNSVSHYLREAIKEFSGQSPKDRIETRRKIAEYYISIDAKIAHIGGNLNQAMQRCNESAKAGLPTATILINHVLPKVQDTYSMLIEMRRSLNDLSSSKRK